MCYNIGMKEINRDTLWKLYFNSEYCARYYLRLSDSYKRRIFWISLSIAVFSCGPLVNTLWELDLSQYGVISGAVAALLGLYLSVSSLPKRLSVAIHAAKVWNKAARDYAEFWGRYEVGEAIDAESIWSLDSDLTEIDNEVLEHLNTHERYLRLADKEARDYLVPAAA